ncbi:MAG: BrnT family toxin [Synergistaceae bacterium]|nr:BrnT family toxin [Synergistaceae bacterium]MBR0151749.1 BrnT family toxin [Synergistaceae bacterium]MBR0257884.1 BrnT family toxin [Synergistaceae bacterium]
MRETEYGEVKLREGGMSFTWDDRKAVANLRKHGVSFTEAAAIFFDENVVIEFNSIDKWTGEERLNAIGLVYGNMMYMVYVERVTVDNEDVVRIISARKATKQEAKIYDYGLSRHNENGKN